MLRSLVRGKFVDRTWSQEDLDLIAKFWLLLYQKQCAPSDKPPAFHQILEICLTNSQLSATAGISEALARRLLEAGVPVEVSATDLDTLIAKTKPRSGNEPPFAGLGIPALAGAPFDGLVVEIRFTVVDASMYWRSAGLIGATLVIVGELCNGTVAVKSLWVDPAFVPNASAWQTPPDWDDRLLAAFDRFRSDNEVNEELARAVFVRSFHQDDESGGALEAIGQWLKKWPDKWPERWLRVLGSGSRSRGLLVLCAIMVALVATLGTIACLIPAADWGICFYIGVIPFMWVVFTFSLTVIKTAHDAFWVTYLETRVRYHAHYHTFVRFAPIPPRDQPWLTDPVVRKVTTTLLHAGFTHAGDYALVPIDSAICVQRAFLARDGVTYLCVGFNYAGGDGTARWLVWPATFGCFCLTRDSEGRYFQTLLYDTPLTVLKREDPIARWLVLPESTRPLALFDAHVKAVELWVRESGAELLKHEPFEKCVVQLADSANHERDAYSARPYSWQEHVRWYLQRDAKSSDNSK